jgi:parallel beta-helix repeat protein
MKVKFLTAVLVLTVLLGFGSLSYADGKTHYVPKDFATLQEAINAAEDGDTISVADGTYKGNINFKGKSITLTSDSANTVIEGTEAGSVVTIDSNSTLSGFIITSKNIDARGIYVKDASPTIENCTIIGNETTESGGGIYSTANSSPQIINCIITENGETVQVYGGTPQISFSFVGDQGLVNTTANQQTVNTTEIITTEPQPPTTEPEVESANVSYKPGELIVRFAPKQGVRLADAKKIENQRSMSEKKAILDSLGGGEIKHNFKIVQGLTVVKLPPGLSVEKALEKFNKAKEKGEILYAEPNYIVRAYSTFPNDISGPNELTGGQQWGLHNIGQWGGTPDADIDAPEAWDIATNANSITIAVIDTGVDYTHPDLAANIWINSGEDHEPLGVVGPEDFDGVDNDGNGYIDDIRGWDCSTCALYDYETGECLQPKAPDNDPMDDIDHGTHCAGIMGAVGNNIEGIVGVSWNVKIMPVKFLAPDEGGYGTGTIADAIAAIEYSKIAGAKLSNNSWGGCPYDQNLKDAIDEAGAAGMLFVAAVGNPYHLENPNNDQNPRYPASFGHGYDDKGNSQTPSESIIAVMATNHNDERWFDPGTYSSAFGPTTVDLGAPGANIYSCVLDGNYESYTGTSMAAPHVTGACALLWSIHPELTNLEVKNIILNMVDKTPDLEFGYFGGKMCVSGGRLNLFHAIINRKAVTWYVDDSVTIPFDQQDGTSWETAFKYLQDALNNSSLGAYDQIWVAEGTYSPNQAETPGIIPSNQREATFQLVNGVTIKGGYKGGDNSTGNERSIRTYQTTLSGDLAGNDGNPPNFANYGDNSYHVVTGSNTDATATLNGFIITGGNANSSGVYYDGGGMYNYVGSPTVTNCIFYANRTDGMGGGMLNREGSNPTITNCIFVNNFATLEGGGIGNANSSPTITNCTFYGNSATIHGSGIYNVNSEPIVTNCIFWDNGEEIYPPGGYYLQCEIPDDGNGMPFCHTVPTATVSYSNIKGGYYGEGNIDADPLFVNANNPLSDGLRLKYISPCIDAANDTVAPPTDILGKERIDADMGAYEYIPLHVDDNVTIPYEQQDGKSWETAFRYLQDALAVAASNGDELIRVAEGTYQPNQPNQGKTTFQLVNGVTIEGGYAGINASDPNERDITNYQTILSGGYISNHVVTGSNTDATAVLDGFTIKEGRAYYYGYDNPYPYILGAGMYISPGSPTIINCNFTDNSSVTMGGAVHISGMSSYPTFKNCIFYNNYSNGGAGIFVINASVEITNCVFANNRNEALSIVYSEGRPPKVTNCTFYGNDIGLGNMTSGSIITNCIFWGNGGEIDVHDMYDSHTPKPTVTYSNVRGGWGGVGNINSDPLFVNTGDPLSGDGLRLGEGSLCIDAANGDIAPLTDILGQERIDIPGVPNATSIPADMGTYEYIP